MNFIGQQEVLRFLSQAANSAMEGRNVGGIVALTNPDTITSPAFEVLLEAAGEFSSLHENVLIKVRNQPRRHTPRCVTLAPRVSAAFRWMVWAGQ